VVCGPCALTPVHDFCDVGLRVDRVAELDSSNGPELIRLGEPACANVENGSPLIPAHSPMAGRDEVVGQRFDPGELWEIWILEDDG